MPITQLTPDGCRAALVEAIGKVEGVGRVWGYRRIIRNEHEIRQLLTPAPEDERVNVWMVYPAASNPAITVRGTGHHGIGQKGGGNDFTTLQWSIDAYYYINDAEETERTFGNLAWKVATDLNSYGMLRIPGITSQLAADVEQFGYIMLANSHLAHYARIGIGFTGRTHQQ
jgi:hypothetical protein